MMMLGEYKYATVEKKWQNFWGAQGIYRWDSTKERDQTFVIDTPPPTVSGLLHMGHIYSYTQADFIARFQRMLGKAVFYPIGFDDNGLPTERLVEKEKGIKAAAVGRAEFVRICREVVPSYEEEFRNVFKSVALSFDWEQEYQTISDRTRKLSQMSFIDLYRKGLMYRKDAPTFWDVVDQTAIAQAEIEDKDNLGLMLEIKFKTSDGNDIAIATTRPEMLAACVAVFCHPDDARYSSLQGKKSIVPIFNQEVPLLSDAAVDPEKGTGLVMCCTFGDIQDIKWWQDHALPLKSCINKLGRMQNSGALDGLNVKVARAKVIDLLQDSGLILGRQEVKQTIKCAERSGAPLEIIPTHQWYIAVLEHKTALLEQSAKCAWHPEYMKVRLDNWIKGLNQDWCISRQRYFGVPFPVWYSKRKGEEGKILLAGIEQLPADPSIDLPHGYSAEEVSPELDVMDTWATSALTPQLSSWGINDDITLDINRHKRLFPADLRPQAHEIIRTWAFATIVKSFYHQNSIPWRSLMVSGWCLAEDKSKMSKSKGNIVVPQKLIEEKSADVVRYWASTAKLGADIVYSEKALEVGSKLMKKIWNAAKFYSMHISKMHNTNNSLREDVEKGVVWCPADLWILSKTALLCRKATEALHNFDYYEARSLSENFFLKQFCDNYIELVKHRLYNDADASAQQSGLRTFRGSFEVVLKLLAPFLPHITEEIYKELFDSRTSIHATGSWPNLHDQIVNEEMLAAGEAAVAILDLVRKAKSNLSVSIAKEVALLEIASDINDIEKFVDVGRAANAKETKIVALSDMKEGALISDCGSCGVRLTFVAP